MSDKKVYLIYLETGGNQAYIFSTNKLRDVVGASELLYRTGTSYVERAIDQAARRPEPFRTTGLCEEAPIEATSGDYIEAIIATSGKALLLADSECTAKRFIRAWSRIVTAEAPGVDAVAVYSCVPIDLEKPLDRNLEGSFMEAYHDAMKRYSLHRMNRPSPLARFQRIPVVAPCQHSGQPASKLSSNEAIPVSYSTCAKIEVTRGEERALFERRMRGLYPVGMDDIIRHTKGLEALEGLEWLGVVHADGNGLGQFFTNLAEHVTALCEEEEPAREANGRDYVNYYRRFSDALDKISRASFMKTVEKIFNPDRTQEGASANIVPIVVGGDDLTAVMDGRKAVAFAKSYMESFCQATVDCPDTRELLEAAGLPRLGMCAGICIAKPHFPFSESYRLAEELMKEAKKVKKPFGNDAMALDFHILYDSVATSMKDIRERLDITEAGTTRRLTAKPYAILREQDRERTGQNPEERQTIQLWRNVHDFEKFLSAVDALRAKELSTEGKDALLFPSSQSHAVREDLFAQHLETQEAEWRYLMGRYGKFREKWRCESRESLYVEVDSMFHTFFLDALEAARFMEGLTERSCDAQQNGQNGQNGGNAG